MKKMKKVLSAAMAMGLMIPAFGTTLLAAEVTGEGATEVSYDNTKEIPDPANPDNPGWAVVIPSSIKFTDANKKVNADVEIIAKNGGTLPTESVTITAVSTNAYKLKAGTDEMTYTLQYGGTTLTNTNLNVGVFTTGVTKLVGEAVLTGTATKTGSYTDTLTYTVAYTPAP